MNDFYVYEWIRLDTNEPFYVGKGRGGRAYYPYRNRYFNNIIKKLGFENVAVVILHEDLTEEEALEYEVYYIAVYKDEFGFKLSNMTDGGEGVAGFHHSEETREKLARVMREVRAGENAPMYGKVHSKEARLKMSKSKLGFIPWNKGKEMPKESIERMRKKLIGKKHTEETKEKIRQASLGRKHSNDTKKKISEKNSGENNGMYGKTYSHTEEVKKYLSKVNSGKNNGMYGKPSPNRKKILKLDPETREIIKIYDCIKDACEDNNISGYYIGKSAKQKTVVKGNLLFSYE